MVTSPLDITLTWSKTSANSPRATRPRSDSLASRRGDAVCSPSARNQRAGGSRGRLRGCAGKHGPRSDCALVRIGRFHLTLDRGIDSVTLDRGIDSVTLDRGIDSEIERAFKTHISEYRELTAEIRVRISNQFTMMALAATILSLAAPLAAIITASVVLGGTSVPLGPITITVDDLYLLLVPAIPLWGLTVAFVENELMIRRLGAYIGSRLAPKIRSLARDHEAFGWESFYLHGRGGDRATTAASAVLSLGRHSLTVFPAAALTMIYAAGRFPLTTPITLVEGIVLLIDMMAIVLTIVSRVWVSQVSRQLNDLVRAAKESSENNLTRKALQQ